MTCTRLTFYAVSCNIWDISIEFIEIGIDGKFAAESKNSNDRKNMKTTIKLLCQYTAIKFTFACCVSIRQKKFSFACCVGIGQ